MTPATKSAYTHLMTLTPKTYAPLALLLSSCLLIGAWVFQYGLGYAPCQMCYWQRWAHMGVIALAALACISNWQGWASPRLWTGLIILGLLVSTAIAFWHTGVEFKWWEGPKTCSGGTGAVVNPDDLLSSLGGSIKPPACADAPWHFLGLSMAAWNTLASLFGAVAGLAALRRRADV